MSAGVELVTSIQVCWAVLYGGPALWRASWWSDDIACWVIWDPSMAYRAGSTMPVALTAPEAGLLTVFDFAAELA